MPCFVSRNGLHEVLIVWRKQILVVKMQMWSVESQFPVRQSLPSSYKLRYPHCPCKETNRKPRRPLLAQRQNGNSRVRNHWLSPCPNSAFSFALSPQYPRKYLTPQERALKRARFFLYRKDFVKKKQDSHADTSVEENSIDKLVYELYGIFRDIQ